MKTSKLLIIFVILLSIHSNAQTMREEQKDQMKTIKIGFITNELNLTADEATKFWPIYNAYDDKQFEIRHKKMRVFKDRMDTNLDAISEKDATSILIQMENNEEELYQIRKKFITNIKGILPSTKILKLKKAEEDFNRKLLQQYRSKRSKR
jgi:Spy/CpxP family protein refolding chaperone